MQTETTYKNGERKLLEITAGEPSNSRFSVCFWLDGEWIMDDRPGLGLLKTSGYSIVAIHNLPNRTYPPNDLSQATASGAKARKANEP